MRVYSHPDSFQKEKPVIATIGTFDGVHLGHRAILSELIQAAKTKNGESLIITFHPHPRSILFPEDTTLKVLQSLEEKLAALEELGIDKVLVIPFTRAFSEYSSSRFIKEILVDRIGISQLIIGYDHHFGKDRSGGLKELQAVGPEFGFDVAEIPALKVQEANVSSTKIRNALLEGNLEIATAYLGRPYQLSGKVVKGDQMGRTIGFPTANLELLEPLKLVPANGVYIVQAEVEQETYQGMMNIGYRPTVNGLGLRLEVHLLDVSLDLYDKNLTVRFLSSIRSEEKFPSLEALKTQLSKDKETTRAFFSGR